MKSDFTKRRNRIIKCMVDPIPEDMFLNKYLMDLSMPVNRRINGIGLIQRISFLRRFLNCIVQRRLETGAAVFFGKSLDNPTAIFYIDQL